MSERISRRQFTARAVVGAASASLAGRVLAAEPVPAAQGEKPKDGPHQDLPHLNKQIAKPVPEDLVKGVSTSLTHNDDLFAARWKHRLEEGSEPTSIYRAVRR